MLTEFAPLSRFAKQHHAETLILSSSIYSSRYVSQEREASLSKLPLPSKHIQQSVSLLLSEPKLCHLDRVSTIKELRPTTNVANVILSRPYTWPS